MPTPQQWAVIAMRTDWTVLLLSVPVLLGIATILALFNRYALPRMRIVRFATITFGYALGGTLFLRLFSALYVRAYVRLFETIPGSSGVADHETATSLASSQVSGLFDVPPAADFVAYPAWMPVAIPIVAWAIHMGWQSTRRPAV